MFHFYLQNTLIHFSVSLPLSNFTDEGFSQLFVLKAKTSFESIIIKGNCCWQLIGTNGTMYAYLLGQNESTHTNIVALRSHECTIWDQIIKNNVEGTLYILNSFFIPFSQL